MKTTLQIDGLSDLGKAMSGLTRDIAKKVAFAGVLAGAGVIKKAAKQNAHVAQKAYEVRLKAGDKPQTIQPGNIGKKLATKRIKGTLTAQYAVFVKNKYKDGFAGRAARLMEFGTVNQPAKPFMRPAFEANKEKAAYAIKDRLAKRIEKANSTTR